LRLKRYRRERGIRSHTLGLTKTARVPPRLHAALRSCASTVCPAARRLWQVRSSPLDGGGALRHAAIAHRPAHPPRVAARHARQQPVRRPMGQGYGTKQRRDQRDSRLRREALFAKTSGGMLPGQINPAHAARRRSGAAASQPAGSAGSLLSAAAVLRASAMRATWRLRVALVRGAAHRLPACFAR